MLTLRSLEEARFHPNTFFVYSRIGNQDRANVDFWTARNAEQKSQHLSVIAYEGDIVTLRSSAGGQIEVNVKDVLQLRDLFPGDGDVVIDISDIGHDFWSGCLVALRGHVKTLTYVYTEPREYELRAEPDRAKPFDLFDLSPSTMGLRALTGFANLSPGTVPSLFVPLLGFEGQRALNLLNEVDPTKTVPIIGIPGYRIEFPVFTAYCNRDLFEQTDSQLLWRNAPANDPFALRRVLKQIRLSYQKHYMYVAPIGTRPHALGALLYVQDDPESSEILFDHPVSRRKSRHGRGPSHLYRIFP